MRAVLDFIVTYQSVFGLLIGMFLPYLNSRLEKIIHSERYKFAAKVYQQIDPQVMEALGDRLKFLEIIEESISSLADGKLDYKEVQQISRLVFKNFSLPKALGSKA